MPVQITINGADAAESLRELSALATGLTGAVAIPFPAVEAPKQTRKKKEESAPEQPEEKQEPKQGGEPVKPEQPASDVGDDDSDVGGGGPIPTDVELREIGSSKGKTNREGVKALLNKYGVPNITSVPNDKRVAFKRDLEAL
jgi:hypothetical protein